MLGVDSSMTNDKNDIIIPLSKKKNVLLVLGSLLFVALGFFLLMIPEEEYGPSLFSKVAAYSCIVLFGLCAIVGVMKLFDKKPGLVINDKGIFDNSSGVSVGLIPWSTIMFIRVSEIVSSKFILIGVANAEKIMSEQNIFKKFMLKSTNKIYGTPVSLNPTALQVKLEELENILLEKWNLYKGQSAETSRIEGAEVQKKPIDYKLFSTGWMVAATFIGGPLAGFYLLSVNFRNLGRPQFAKTVLLKGILISVVFFSLIIFLPLEITDMIPKSFVPIFYSILMGIYADIRQGSDVRNHIKAGGKKHSGWKAAGVGIVCLFLTFLYILILGTILDQVAPLFT